MSEKELDSSNIEYTEETKPEGYVKQLEWDMAIGLQEVDNLKPSKYLEKLLEENVSGNLTIKQVEEELREYYIEKDKKQELNHNELECDFVSTRIVELLQIDNFELSVDYLKYIHKYLFQDVYEFAGEFRKIDFSKHEKILNNDDVLITKEKDINNPKLVSAFPDIVEKTNRKEDGLEYFIKVTDNINKKNEKRNKIAEKIFSYKQPIVTYIIMAICIILFILMELSGGSTNSQTLLKYGANLDVLVKNGEYYRLFTCIFLHIGIMHLLCNMYSLYIIGREVENLFGKIKYIIIFILSGIFGSIMSLAFTHNTISAGASGAIFGLLGALLYFGMHYRTYLGEAIKRSIIPIIVVNLIIGFFAEGIDLAAHIGGLVGGVLVAMMVGVPDKSKIKDIINGTILTIIYLIFISYLAFWR